MSNSKVDNDWQADRNLARDLLSRIHELLLNNQADWPDLTGLAVYSGPGSFTGLRIGVTVMNTLADSLDIPIVGATGETWQESALADLLSGKNDRIVLPNYGADAKITTPKK